MGDETEKRKAEPLPVGSHRYHIHGPETTVVSGAYRLRRVDGFVVVENIKPKLLDGEELREAFHQAELKEDKLGVILHLPMPNYVSSMVIVAMREIGRRMHREGKPFVAVLHPKLRLLLEIFDLKNDIPTEVRLDNAIEYMKRQLEGK